MLCQGVIKSRLGYLGIFDVLCIEGTTALAIFRNNNRTGGLSLEEIPVGLMSGLGRR